MDLTGAAVIAAPREKVWAALNDPEILAACIEGCERLERLEDGSFDGTVAAKIGPVSARFQGRVTLSDVDPPNGYTITGEGKGGVAGFAKGAAKVSLADEPDGTRLSYVVDAKVGGKLAQVGARLIDSVAKAQAEQFFQRFKAVLEAPAPAGAAAAAESAGDQAAAEGPAAPPASSPSPEPQPASAAREGLPSWAWAAALGVGLLILLYVLLA